jgi:amino acid transporter
MFTFISSWRTAAIVLSDLGSTAYYIGGIVEQAIGPAAPWYILAVMLFSYAVRSVYIESVSLFVRGGVYRVTREAMGGTLAKVAVSALLFDYILTGPISSVSAGQYIMGLLFEVLSGVGNITIDPALRLSASRWGAVILAVAATLYFYRLNILGIHESSDKALKIMIVTSVMAVVVLGWGVLTLAIEGPRGHLALMPDLNFKMNYTLGELHSPLGFIADSSLGRVLAKIHGREFLSLIGALGVIVAFGHSILAMSGEETLAQVYREVESPKLKNFKKAALIVFLYSFIFTSGVCFLAVLLIPDNVRMARYADNLIGGLAMHVMGPMWARLLLNGLVVVVGSLILSGAVNTAIIGSNGVLNRLAEDGVVPVWFQKPHRRFGTTHRLLTLVVGLQLLTIIASRGDVIVLGEAYAFGVVWSFVLMTASMLILRFRNRRPREFRVPLNVQLGKFELPVGLTLVFLVLFLSAVVNLLTKETATKWGLGFTLTFLSVFVVTERVNRVRRRGQSHEHRDQFNCATAPRLSREELSLRLPYCKLVAIRSPHSMAMLEKSLAEADPDTTDVVVMTAKVTSGDGDGPASDELTDYEQQLMTAVVARAELAGKVVRPLIVPTNNPLHAILRAASEIGAQEIVLGASNKYTAQDQVDLVSLYWLSLHGGEMRPVTIRIVSRNRDLVFDLAGGNRIPTIGERKAKSIAEMRAAGEGVGRVLLAYDGTAGATDLFQSVLTMLDAQVGLTVVSVAAKGADAADGDFLDQVRNQSARLNRAIELAEVRDDPAAELCALALQQKADLVIYMEPEERLDERSPQQHWTVNFPSTCPCQVLIAPRMRNLDVVDE